MCTAMMRLKFLVMTHTKEDSKMKAFSVVFRDNITGQLCGGIVDQQELARLVNNTAITVCVTRQIWGA